MTSFSTFVSKNFHIVLEVTYKFWIFGFYFRIPTKNTYKSHILIKNYWIGVKGLIYIYLYFRFFNYFSLKNLSPLLRHFDCRDDHCNFLYHLVILIT